MGQPLRFLINDAFVSVSLKERGRFGAFFVTLECRLSFSVSRHSHFPVHALSSPLGRRRLFLVACPTALRLLRKSNSRSPFEEITRLLLAGPFTRQ